MKLSERLEATVVISLVAVPVIFFCCAFYCMFTGKSGTIYSSISFAISFGLGGLGALSSYLCSLLAKRHEKAMLDKTLQIEYYRLEQLLRTTNQIQYQ